MSPLLPAATLAGCVALAAVGTAMMRSTPSGATSLLPEEEQRERRPGPVERLRERIVLNWTPWVLERMSERRKRELRQRLEAAGRPGGLTLDGYVRMRLARTVTGGLLGLAATITTGSVVLAPAGLVVGHLLSDVLLSSAARRRQAAIEQQAPDFLDVLSVTVQAGLSFRHAMERVAETLGGPMGEEVQTTLRQMALGASRRQAFQALRERNPDSEGLNAFVTALLQAEELGAPLSDTLASIADDLRAEFAQSAKQRAAKTAPRVSLVVVLVILPAAMALLIGGFVLSMDFDRGMLGG